jgi:hypothetical protein
MSIGDKMLNKRKSHAFGKDIYLVGKDKDGKFVWLEAPVWDCGWYWGFGYMETYTNNRSPENSRDIQSHSHWSGFVGKVEHYDFDKKSFVLGEYRHHINESDLMAETVLTEKESWLLSDLMQSFYSLKEAAEVLGRGDSHLTTDSRATVKDTEMGEKINKIILPKLFKEVLTILSPE